MIEFQNVSYTYPNRTRPAVHGLDLGIEVGQFVLISGPSSSGKSTFLRIINGLVPHFSGGTISGLVRVNTKDVIKAGPAVMSRHIGFVSQNPEAQALLETVEPEIAFTLENAAVPTVEMHERVAKIMALLGITDICNRAIVTLSGGERQRVAIASALALNPEILILDEPTSQLDPESAAGILELLHRLNRELGMTIVLAEHRLERVLPYVDRIAYFERGSLKFFEPVRTALALIPEPPPLVELARLLHWEPLPLSIDEGLKHSASSTMENTLLVTPRRSSFAGKKAGSRPLLAVKNVRFTYDNGEKALRGISLGVDSGEILAIMGQNGSGKSTLLKCIVGLLDPGEGDISFQGASILGKKTVELAADIAYLPQYPDDLLFAETVRDELEITLSNHGIKSNERVDQLLRVLDLAEDAQSYPRDLSTGQRQRVALGAITVTEPRILLLDEPTRGLDGRLKKELVQLWRKWRASGMSLILVTHDVELVVQLADRVIILDQGRIDADGLVHDVLGADSAFAPQIARLFPGKGWLTTGEVLAGLSSAQ